MNSRRMRRRASKHHESLLPWAAAAGTALIVGWLAGDPSDPPVSAASTSLMTTGALSLVTAGAVGWPPAGGGLAAAGLGRLAGRWVPRINVPLDEHWQRIRAWVTPHHLRPIEWTTTRLARTAEQLRRSWAERALRRTRARIEAVGLHRQSESGDD